MELAASAVIDAVAAAPPPRRAVSENDEASFDDHLDAAAPDREAKPEATESEEPAPDLLVAPPIAAPVETTAAPLILQIEPGAAPAGQQAALAPIAPMAPQDGEIAASAPEPPPAEAISAAAPPQRPIGPDQSAKTPAAIPAPAPTEAAAPQAQAPAPEAPASAPAPTPPPQQPAAPDMLAALQALAGLRTNRDAQSADPQRGAENAVAEAETSAKRGGEATPEGAKAQPRGPAPAAMAMASEAAAAQRAAIDVSSANAPAGDLSALSSGASQGLHTQMADTAARAAPIIAQVGREIIRRFAGQSTQFDLRLDPPELGRVDVRLDVSRDHRLTAVITADNPQALAELVRHARDLEQTLQSAGLQLADNGLAFDLRQGRDDTRQAERSQGGDDLLNAAQDDSVPAPLMAARPLGYERWRGVRLDVMV